MDPNETLETIRSEIARYHNLDPQDDIDALDWVDYVSDLFEGLDDWLTAGGFKPSDWQR